MISAENAISKIILYIWWNIEQILHLWHTRVGLRNNGDWMPRSAWPGVGESFWHGNLPQLSSVVSGVD